MNSDSRKIMAVMFTDVAGFTGHMEQNEAAALKILSLIRTALIHLLENHSGQLVKEMGDGTLSIFQDSGSAVKCAKDLQKNLEGNEFSLRIGIHRGSVFLRTGDVLGDTVNVASRLEKMAPPGGICISGELLESCDTGRKPDVNSLGLRKLKGLGRLINLYTVKGTVKHPLPDIEETSPEQSSIVNLEKEVPSVAVMPLENLGPSGDEFYANGITSDMISQLTSAGGIAVTPLNDVVKLKKAVSSGSDIASRLSVRFLVTGTLCRKEKRFQLSVELHDLQRNKLAWTDSWTDDWFELPSIKAKVADSLLKVFGIQRTLLDQHQGGSQAYELYLQAADLYWKRQSFTDVESARKMLRKALEIDPELIEAGVLLGTSFSETGDFSSAETELRRAYEIAQYRGDRSGHLKALIWIGINQWRQSDFKGAKQTFLRTMMLARTLNELQTEARSLSNMGLMECNLGEYDSALEHFQRALEVPGVSSMGNLKANTLCNIGLTHWSMGDNESAYEYYLKSISLYENLESIDGQATMMMNLGIVTRNMGHFQASIEYTRKAFDLHIRIGDRQGQCRSMIGIGNTHRFTGNSEEALKSYYMALEIASEIGDRMICSIARTNIADILSDREEYREAEKLYREALEICEEIGDREGEGENLSHLGLILGHLGRPEDAAGMQRKAISVFERIGAPARSVMARLNLADAILDTNPGTDGLKEAMDQARKAEELVFSGMNDLIQTNLALSDLYRKFSGIPAAGNSKRLAGKSRTFLAEAYRSLMRIADTIDDNDLRESFLRIKKHSRIIRDYGQGG